MHGKYAILCNEKGGILNDPVLLRLSEDEFWFSISDSDLLLWMQGVNVAKQFNVEIDEFYFSTELHNTLYMPNHALTSLLAI